MVDKQNICDDGENYEKIKKYEFNVLSLPKPFGVIRILPTVNSSNVRWMFQSNTPGLILSKAKCLFGITSTALQIILVVFFYSSLNKL